MKKIVISCLIAPTIIHGAAQKRPAGHNNQSAFKAVQVVLPQPAQEAPQPEEHLHPSKATQLDYQQPAPAQRQTPTRDEGKIQDTEQQKKREVYFGCWRYYRGEIIPGHWDPTLPQYILLQLAKGGGWAIHDPEHPDERRLTEIRKREGKTNTWYPDPEEQDSDSASSQSRT